MTNQLLEWDPELPVHQGFILNGFPFNVRQALMLDRYIKGINLAIYFRNENKSHEQSIAELLDYYDQRVHLN